jgi:hypothetical protein
VVVGVVPDEVPVRGDPTRRAGLGLGPSALDEERRADVLRRQRIEQALRVAGGRGAVGMFGVEGQGNSEAGYFSTPVMTIPRVKKRWNTRNSSTGMIIVISVPAWMYSGFL